MIVAIYSVKRVVGGDLLLLVWGVCAAVYLACGLWRRRGRGKAGRRWLLAGLLASEVLLDVCCFPVFFPGGAYHNWGVGSVYVVFLWPAALAAAYALTAVFRSEGRGRT